MKKKKRHYLGHHHFFLWVFPEADGQHPPLPHLEGLLTFFSCFLFVRISVFLVWRMFDLMENIICEFYDHELCYPEALCLPLLNGANSIWIWQLHTEILINHWIVPSKNTFALFQTQFDCIVYSPYSDLSAYEFICADVICCSLP